MTYQALFEAADRLAINPLREHVSPRNVDHFTKENDGRLEHLHKVPGKNGLLMVRSFVGNNGKVVIIDIKPMTEQFWGLMKALIED